MLTVTKEQKGNVFRFFFEHPNGYYTPERIQKELKVTYSITDLYKILCAIVTEGNLQYDTYLIDETLYAVFSLSEKYHK